MGFADLLQHPIYAMLYILKKHENFVSLKKFVRANFEKIILIMAAFQIMALLVYKFCQKFLRLHVPTKIYVSIFSSINSSNFDLTDQLPKNIL